MRFAVISDIHANFPALLAVERDLKKLSPDFVIVAGDFLNRGPQPRQVLEFLLEKKWRLLRGNHEDYVVAQCENFTPDDMRANPIWQPARWTAEQLDKNDDTFRHLPLTTSFDATNLQTPDALKNKVAPDIISPSDVSPSDVFVGADLPDNVSGSESLLRGESLSREDSRRNRVLDGRVLVAHGTPQVNSDGVFGKTSDEQLRQMLGAEAPSLFIGAHTHVALMRQIDGTSVVNVGSVGLPFNGDARAQYGVFTWKNGSWKVELRQLEYDREPTYRAFETNGFLKNGGPLARVILREVETARPHLGPWVRQFAEQVRAGEMTVEDATKAYFKRL